LRTPGQGTEKIIWNFTLYKYSRQHRIFTAQS